MREDNLLCVRKRKFVVTTDSNHTRKVYPNRAAGDMSLTAMNQLWRADITYHPLARRVRLPGRGSGCLLATCYRLERWIERWKIRSR